MKTPQQSERFFLFFSQTPIFVYGKIYEQGLVVFLLLTFPEKFYAFIN